MEKNEKKELVACDEIELKAKTNLNLIIHHFVSDCNNGYLVNERYNMKFAQGGLSFQQIGRMRMTSYAVRTWLGTEQQVNNK